MKDTVGFGSPEVRINLSHVSDGDLVLEIRQAVDDKRDRLDWICVPLAQVSGLAGEARAAMNGAERPRAANDDRAGPTARPDLDNSGYPPLPARTPV